MDIAELLIGKGANVNAGENSSGNTPLNHAVNSKNVKLCRLLLESGADVNASAVFSAANSGLSEIAGDLMLKASGRVCLKDHNGMNPLHHAVSSGSIPTVETIVFASIGSGYDVFYDRDMWGRTPLHLAAALSSDGGYYGTADKYFEVLKHLFYYRPDITKIEGRDEQSFLEKCTSIFRLDEAKLEEVKALIMH